VPGLLRALDTNLRRGVRDVRLFETGRVFGAAPRGTVWPLERRHAGIVWTGAGRPRHWSEPDREVDLEDVLGAIEAVLDGMRPGPRWTRRPGTGRTGFHPGRSATWSVAGFGDVAWAGALHPSAPGDFAPGTYAGEVDLGALASIPVERPRHQTLARLTTVTRDLALVLGPGTSFGRLAQVLEAVPAPARVRFEPVDRYSGPPLGADEISLTVRAVLEPEERTLTDDEIESYRRALAERAERDLGVRLRGAG
jgi:phenylalanyl-tRNA synthetase beta chain